jgi:nicotinamide riboside transporter PnuC
MYWTITILSILGAVFNSCQNRWGFVCWMFSNAAWLIIDFQKGIPEQSVTFFVFFLTSLWGFVCWSKQGKLKKESVL